MLLQVDAKVPITQTSCKLRQSFGRAATDEEFDTTFSELARPNKHKKTTYTTFSSM